MQALMFFAALVIAWIAQKFNADPEKPTIAVKLSTAVAGPVLYLMVDQPGGWPGSADFLVWWDKAWLWTLALPGMASLIALTPKMATKTAAVLLACGLMFMPTRSYAADPAVRLNAGANVSWVEPRDGGSSQDYEVGINARASLQPHLSAVGGVYRGLDAGYWMPYAGVRVTVTDVDNRQFSAGAGLEYHAAVTPIGPKEWVATASVGHRPWPAPGGLKSRVTLAAQGGYGLTSGNARVLAGIRFGFNL